MGRFTADEATEFYELRAACYRGMGTLELLAFLSKRLQSLLGADAFCANELDPSTALLTRAVSEGWPDEAKRLLVERVFMKTPAADPPRFVESGWRAVDVDSLVTHSKKPLRDPYFAHHLLPFGYRYEVMMLCKLKGSGRGLLTFSRKPGRGRNGERDLRLLDALAPHVAAGITRGNLRDILASRDEPGLGVLVLDERGQLEVANALAETWLSSDAGDRWSLGLPLLIDLISRTPSGQDLVPAPFLELTHPDNGAPYRIYWERGRGVDGTPRTVLFLEPIRRLDSAETLHRLGLTPRETDVTLSMLRGLSAKEIAGRLNLSTNTVNQHSQSVFSKLGVSSRIQLAALLMGAIRLGNSSHR